MSKSSGTSARAAFRAPARVDLSDIDPRGRPVGPKDKAAAAERMDELRVGLDGLQEALTAEAAGGGSRAVLLVLQGMDTSGKGGVISHVAGLVDPQGLRIASFKRPTPEELEHDFLWRIRKQVPAAGQIGVFDRSHYEDVLIARVDALVSERIWRARYGKINTFETELAASGVTVVKCMLHISPDKQEERLLARLDERTKRWKYNPSDVDSRLKWPAYREAYTEVLQRCSTNVAPWYIIPSDRKWYRNWAIAAVLAETLAELDPQFPEPSYDVRVERERVLSATVK